jgi:hypothetical protein
MPINPNISLAVRGIELQDPLAQYGKVSAIQNAQQQNQLAQMQMQESQRDLAATNALNQAYAKAYNADTGEVDLNALRSSLATGGYGSKLPGIEKSIFEGREAKTKALKGETDLLDAKLKQSRQFLETIDPNNPASAEAYMAWHRANHADPVIGKALEARGITVEQSLARIQQLMQTPGGLARLINESKLGTDNFMEMNKPNTTQVNRGGQTDIIQTPGLGGAPTTVGTFTEVPLPADVQAQKKQIAQAGATVMPAQEKAFEVELGKGQAEEIKDSRSAAVDAADILETNHVGRQILQSGAITGSGANFFVGFNNALKQAGIDAGYADAAANSQAYGAAMATNTAKLIKAFGAGTGLSDADREYALKAAAGDVTMTETAIRRILDINDKAANRVIDKHNDRVKGIKSIVPLTVKKPVFSKPSSGTEGIPGASPPPRNAAPNRTITRTGTMNGRKVIEYSDGSIEYAN